MDKLIIETRIQLTDEGIDIQSFDHEVMAEEQDYIELRHNSLFFSFIKREQIGVVERDAILMLKRSRNNFFWRIFSIFENKEKDKLELISQAKGDMDKLVSKANELRDIGTKFFDEIKLNEQQGY